MLNRYTKLRLVDLLYNLADGEIKTEALRQVLAEKYEFEPYAAFKRIAGKAPSPYLSNTDLQDFLSENNIDIASRETQQLLDIFDTDRDSRISFNEFLNVILPKDDPKLRQKATLRPSYHLLEGERLPYDIEYGLARILEQELNNFLKVENLKQQLSLCYDFSINNAFKTLDLDGKDYLIPEDIADFMEENGRLIDEKELNSLFRKIDQDLDGKITYKEFREAMFSVQSDLSTSKQEKESKEVYSSPLGSTRQSAELEKAVGAPQERDLRDLEYSEYLIESQARNSRSSSPKREDKVEEKKEFQTPGKFEREELSGQYSSKKKSPLKGNEEEEFVRALKEIINNSKLLESTKNDLALRSDFNLFDAYRYFDLYGKSSFINQKEFQEGLNALKIFPTRDEISLFFKRFDSDSDGFLRFTDFHNIIAPKATDFAKLIESRKPKYVLDDDDEIFSEETHLLLGKVLDLAIENEVQAESIRQRLSRRPLFNLFDAFKALDRYEQGYIVIEDLKEILVDYGIFASTKDLSNLLERFKNGNNLDGKISYSDFVKELSPKSIRNY